MRLLILIIASLALTTGEPQYTKTVRGNYATKGYHNYNSHLSNNTQNVNHWGTGNINGSMEVGVCYIEVPTASLAKDPSKIPTGNGSRSDLSRIRTCCSGYIRNIHNYLICDPVCSEECINSLCTAPETCTCFPEYVKNEAGFCVATCPIGCQNGRCDGGECMCNEGYTLHRNGYYCVPVCRDNCGAFGNCSAPNTCSCGSGYETSQGGSCRPRCTACANGECVAPNDCRCRSGYYKDEKGNCKARCDRGCTLNGVCTAPNICTYPNGITAPSGQEPGTTITNYPQPNSQRPHNSQPGQNPVYYIPSGPSQTPHSDNQIGRLPNSTQTNQSYYPYNNQQGYPNQQNPVNPFLPSLNSTLINSNQTTVNQSQPGYQYPGYTPPPGYSFNPPGVNYYPGYPSNYPQSNLQRPSNYPYYNQEGYPYLQNPIPPPPPSINPSTVDNNQTTANNTQPGSQYPQNIPAPGFSFNPYGGYYYPGYSPNNPQPNFQPPYNNMYPINIQPGQNINNYPRLPSNSSQPGQNQNPVYTPSRPNATLVDLNQPGFRPQHSTDALNRNDSSSIQPIYQPGYYPGYPSQGSFNPQDVRFYDPTKPFQPGYPYQPVNPNQRGYPYQPVNPSQPGYPYQPVNPNQPGYPYQPVNPLQPGFPYQPVNPNQPNCTYVQTSQTGLARQPCLPGQAGRPNQPGQPGSGQPGYPGYTDQSNQPAQSSYPNPPSQYPQNSLNQYDYNQHSNSYYQPNNQVEFVVPPTYINMTTTTPTSSNLQALCSLPCNNSQCVEGNRCVCDNGYVALTDGTGCKPVCRFCINGVCTAPGVCVCNQGFHMFNGVKGRKMCVRQSRIR